MELISLTCKKCNGEIQLDRSKEFGFCTYCGTKVMIQEEVQKIKVEHTGSVNINTSRREENYMRLAGNALKNGNYEEAYTYYTKTLECNCDLWEAAFNKGLCAAYLSTKDNYRFDETFTGIREAQRIVDGKAEAANIYETIQKNSIDLAYYFYNSVMENRVSETFESAQDARNYFYVIERCTALVIYALGLFGNDALAKDEKLESYYRETADTVLGICAKSQKKITYLVGYKNETDRNGNVVSQPEYKKLAPTYEKEMKEYTARLKEIYNGLPSTVSQIAAFDKNIENCRAQIDDYEKSLKTYFIANPEDEKTFKHPGLFGKKKKLEAITAKFPPELKTKMDLSEKCEDDLKKLISSRKRFISANTKR